MRNENGPIPNEENLSEESIKLAPLEKGQAFVLDSKIAVKVSRLNRVSTPEGKLVFPSVKVVAPQDHQISLLRGDEKKVLKPYVKYEFGTVETSLRPEVSSLNIGDYALEMEKQGRVFLFTVRSPRPDLDIKFKYDHEIYVIREGLINHHRAVQTQLQQGIPLDLKKK